MSMAEMKRIIVIDAQGFVLGFFEHPAGRRVELNPLRVGGRAVPKEKRKYAIDGKHYEPGCERWRWNRSAKAWEKPQDQAWLVDQAGQLRRQVSVFRERLPAVPDGFALVFSEPPADRAKWGGAKWTAAQRFALVDDGGVVRNFALAFEASSLSVPDGWTVRPASSDDELVQ